MIKYTSIFKNDLSLEINFMKTICKELPLKAKGNELCYGNPIKRVLCVWFFLFINHQNRYMKTPKKMLLAWEPVCDNFHCIYITIHEIQRTDIEKRKF